MHYRELGNSGLRVSEIALGSWLTYGVTVDGRRARECVGRALDLGINLIDTANMYGRGSAETLLGETLSGFDRGSYLLATKVYFPMSDSDRGLSREQIRKQIDASLKRLQTEYVDLYQCHRYDSETPLEETMEAMSEVVAAGKARYIGFSQWSPKQIRAAAAIADKTRFVSSQPQYSMLHRKPERRVFPLCEQLGIGQIVYSPLAQGVLTGKYLPNSAPPADARAANPKIGRKIRRFTEDSVLRAVQQLKPIAERCSLTMSQLALAWVLRDGRVSSAIIGASRPEQIEENVRAAGITLDSATLAAIDGVLEVVIRR